MLYLEDYLELIEHLPQELRDRLTLIRENDLKVNNSSQHIDTKVKHFFAEAQKLSPDARQCSFDSILKDYEKTINNADEKLQLADQTSEIMMKLIQKLDGELDKFKLELEAAALSSAINPTSAHNNKISQNGYLKGVDFANGTDNPALVRQDPLAAAASQAIAATQQLHQGRRTPSLKASLAAISGAGLGQLDHLGYTNRNALAPMAPDQQAYRYNQQYGKMGGNSTPLYMSVTKSGRPTKRPKHHASHHYPDESPASISSDNSVFENSESMSSAEFLHERSPAFGSSSPSSFDYNRSHMSDQGGTTNGEYQLDQTKYCICRQLSYGGMVACDNEDCEIQWFHFECVGLTSEPPGKWFCPKCLSSMGSLYKKSQLRSQPHKKRGRKEKSSFNMVDDPPRDTPQN